MKKSNLKLEVVGADEIIEVLKNFDKKLQNEIFQRVHMDVAKKVIKKDIKAGLPYSSRSKRGVVVKKAKRKTGVVTGVSSKAYWLRFTEYGTKERRTRARSRVKYKRSGGKLPTFAKGKVKKQGYVQKAVDLNINKWISVINANYGDITMQELGKKTLELNNKIHKKANK